MPNYDRWELKTAPQLNLGEIKYGNINQPQDQAPSLAKQSVQENQERNRTYSEQRSAINNAFEEMSKTLHHDEETDNWLAHKKQEVENILQGYTAAGDYEGALNKARELASSLKSDAEYQGRVKDNAEYTTARNAIMQRTDLDEEQKEYWDDMNKFETHYNYSSDGKSVTGTKGWKANWTPSKKISVTSFVGGILGSLRANSVANTRESETSNQWQKGSLVPNYNIDKQDWGGTKGRGAGKITTSGSSTRASSRSSSLSEVTAKRLKQAIELEFATNPDALKYFEDQYNMANHFYDKYTQLAADARRSGNEDLANQYETKAKDYRDRLTDSNGCRIHDARAFVLYSIVDKAPGIYKYRNYSLTTSNKISTGSGYDVTLGSDPNNNHYGGNGTIDVDNTTGRRYLVVQTENGYAKYDLANIPQAN